MTLILMLAASALSANGAGREAGIPLLSLTEMAELDRNFTMIDANGDRRISLSEIEGFHTGRKPDPETAHSDGDDHRSISYADFMADAARHKAARTARFLRAASATPNR